RPALPGSVLRGDVRHDDVVTAILVAMVVWIIAVAWLWRGAVRLNRHSLSDESRRRWTTPFLVTAALGAATTVATYVVYRQPWDDTEYAAAAVYLLAGAVAIVAWLPVLFRLEQPRSVTGRGGRVNVNCPECGYSMVGLRAVTCPECGQSYSIDELILAQDYRGREAPAATVEADPDREENA
ncbi:MAG: hypothetical protein ACYTGG_09940, partial [Planctomycetota bacterium]